MLVWMKLISPSPNPNLKAINITPYNIWLVDVDSETHPTWQNHSLLVQAYAVSQMPF